VRKSFFVSLYLPAGRPDAAGPTPAGPAPVRPAGPGGHQRRRRHAGGRPRRRQCPPLQTGQRKDVPDPARRRRRPLARGRLPGVRSVPRKPLQRRAAPRFFQPPRRERFYRGGQGTDRRPLRRAAPAPHPRGAAPRPPRRPANLPTQIRPPAKGRREGPPDAGRRNCPGAPAAGPRGAGLRGHPVPQRPLPGGRNAPAAARPRAACGGPARAVDGPGLARQNPFGRRTQHPAARPRKERPGPAIPRRLEPVRRLQGQTLQGQRLLPHAPRRPAVVAGGPGGLRVPQRGRGRDAPRRPGAGGRHGRPVPMAARPGRRAIQGCLRGGATELPHREPDPGLRAAVAPPLGNDDGRPHPAVALQHDCQLERPPLHQKRRAALRAQPERLSHHRQEAFPRLPRRVRPGVPRGGPPVCPPVGGSQNRPAAHRVLPEQRAALGLRGAQPGLRNAGHGRPVLHQKGTRGVRQKAVQGRPERLQRRLEAVAAGLRSPRNDGAAAGVAAHAAVGRRPECLLERDGGRVRENGVRRGKGGGPQPPEPGPALRLHQFGPLLPGGGVLRRVFDQRLLLAAAAQHGRGGPAVGQAGADRGVSLRGHGPGTARHGHPGGGRPDPAGGSLPALRGRRPGPARGGGPALLPVERPARAGPLRRGELQHRPGGRVQPALPRTHRGRPADQRTPLRGGYRQAKTLRQAAQKSPADLLL
ncbi:MAG: GH50, partial [uncultured Cytophagales bacterium]